ncbi:MAG TPA: NAD(P)H-dependent oxidoreductase [Candidatus Saccharimonadales bacterium]|nr:NAD(P)H-dependent oxidoreductase [Candidatus Saccharimonadales bacterium]
MDKKIKILGISGSLRKNSYNTAAMRIAVSLVPENAEIEVFEKLGEIPPFNQDFEQTPPEIVTELKQSIRAADAILFALPEYNYSIPGVLKNAIDWVSRPYGDNAWEGKPVAMMSASISMLGGARAQYHLRQVFVFLDMHPLNRPEVMIPSAADKFDEQGNLTDTHTKEKIAELLQALVKKVETYH